MEIRLLERGDEAVLRSTVDDVFDLPVDEALTAEFLADPRHHIAVAIEADKVIGFATAVHYVHPDKAAQLFVNEVSVAPEWRGRGVGRAVMKAVLDAGRALGCTEAWVLTNRANPAATALYESAGATDAEEQGLVMYSFCYPPNR